jgi:hypothetical protein
MGNELLVNVLAILVFAATVAILVGGCLLLAARAGVRAWGIYLTAVAGAAVFSLWASTEIYLQWNTPAGMSDDMEVRASIYLNAPLYCTLAVIIGGLLLGLLGRAAAQERVAGV